MDKETENFVVYIAILEALLGRMRIYTLQKAQIATLKQNKAFIKVSTKYVNYTNLFSFNLAMKLPENTSINENFIKVKVGKQPPYRPIYSLGLVELEPLKTYIKTYFKTGFIQSSKFAAGTPILFDKKPDSRF